MFNGVDLHTVLLPDYSIRVNSILFLNPAFNLLNGLDLHAVQLPFYSIIVDSVLLSNVDEFM